MSVALDPAVELAVRAALALLFVHASASKLRGLASFRSAVSDYRLVPRALEGSVALALPVLELALVLGLAYGPSAPWALGGAAGLLAAYAGAIAVNLARGRRHIDCGCFGPAKRQPLHGGLVVRNLAAASVALACAAVPAAARALTGVDAVSVLGTTLVLAATWTATHSLIANAPALARLRRNA